MVSRKDVVFLETGGYQGAAFLIAEDQLLTALHLLVQLDDNKQPITDEDQLPVPLGGPVALTYFVDNRGFVPDVANFDPTTDKHSLAGDWAILRVAPRSDVKIWPTAQLADGDLHAMASTFGFPAELGDEGAPLHGNVTSVRNPRTDKTSGGSYTIQIHKVWVKEPFSPIGCSGGPVVVSGHAVGIVRSAWIDTDGKPTGMSLDVTPIELVEGVEALALDPRGEHVPPTVIASATLSILSICLMIAPHLIRNPGGLPGTGQEYCRSIEAFWETRIVFEIATTVALSVTAIPFALLGTVDKKKVSYPLAALLAGIICLAIAYYYTLAAAAQQRAIDGLTGVHQIKDQDQADCHCRKVTDQWESERTPGPRLSAGLSGAFNPQPENDPAQCSPALVHEPKHAGRGERRQDQGRAREQPPLDEDFDDENGTCQVTIVNEDGHPLDMHLFEVSPFQSPKQRLLSRNDGSFMCDLAAVRSYSVWTTFEENRNQAYEYTVTFTPDEPHKKITFTDGRGVPLFTATTKSMQWHTCEGHFRCLLTNERGVCQSAVCDLPVDMNELQCQPSMIDGVIAQCGTKDGATFDVTARASTGHEKVNYTTCPGLVVEGRLYCLGIDRRMAYPLPELETYRAKEACAPIETLKTSDDMGFAECMIYLRAKLTSSPKEALADVEAWRACHERGYSEVPLLPGVERTKPSHSLSPSGSDSP